MKIYQVYLWRREEERYAGERLAASMSIFLLPTRCWVPQFEDVNDQVALDILSKCFPDRKVVGIPARDILLGGGNIHCITNKPRIGRKEMLELQRSRCNVPGCGNKYPNAERLVRQVADQGAQIILLPELFERPYFCQERQYDY